MKTFKVLFLSAIALLISLNVLAVRTTKKVYRSYALNQVQNVDVTNKYGHIYIDDNRKDSVTVSVEIWVEDNSDKARRLLDQIEVSVNLSGKSVVAVTSVENIFNNNKEFGIDYRISVPADRDLAIDQKYGSVIMKNLTGKGKFKVRYGELTAAKLLSPDLSLEIAYSKANIEQTNDLALTLHYSKLSLDKSANLKTESRYSELNLGEMNGITTDSKYDRYNIKTIGTLKMNSMYSGIKIERLNTLLDIDNGYGNLTIDVIPAGFESINIINKYAGIKIGIASEASYALDGKVRYCDLKHPDGKLNRQRENTSYNVKGTVGKQENPKSKVNIVSNYGSVNLMH